MVMLTTFRYEGVWWCHWVVALPYPSPMCLCIRHDLICRDPLVQSSPDSRGSLFPDIYACSQETGLTFGLPNWGSYLSYQVLQSHRPVLIRTKLAR